MLEVKPVPVPVVPSAPRAEVSFKYFSILCDFFDILIDRHFFGIFIFFLLHHFFANLISSFSPTSFIPSFFSISLASFEVVQ